MSNVKVLLCDDEIHIIKAAEFKFKKSGFDVRCASDGQQGWETIQDFKPDVLITDCQMPRMNGLELASKIRSSAEFQNLPIIMLTGKGYELSELLEKEGLLINCLMTKPFSPRDLVAKVNALVEEKTSTEPTPQRAS